MWNFEDAAHQMWLEQEAAEEATRAEEKAKADAMHALNESAEKYALKFNLPVQVVRQGNKVTIDAREAGRFVVEAKTSTTFLTDSTNGHSSGRAFGIGALKHQVGEADATREIIKWFADVRKAYGM